MKSDMDKLDDLTQVVPMINEIIPLINIVLKEFIRIAKDEFIIAAKKLVDLSNDIRLKEIGLTKCKIVGSRIEYKTILFPVDTAHELINFITE